MVPVQSINTIALLCASGKLTEFTGVRHGAAPFKSVMDIYIQRYQALAGPDHKPTIVELHSGKPIKRLGPPKVPSEPRRKLSYSTVTDEN